MLIARHPNNKEVIIQRREYDGFMSKESPWTDYAYYASYRDALVTMISCVNEGWLDSENYEYRVIEE